MASNISYNSYYGYYGINWANASGNNNIIYSGKETYKASDGTTKSRVYRSRIVLNTANMIISSSSKLVVKITVAQEGSQYYDHTVARLSTYNLTDPGEYFGDDGSPIATITNSTISQSKFYTDSNGNSLVGSTAQAKGNVLYLIFDTKNIIEAGKTYYIYIGREGTSSSRFNAFQASEINLTYESYTVCGAPTSVTASGIITPNGTFTVSWSGAKAGTGNPIDGYDIYYRITSAGSVPTTSTYAGMVSSSLKTTSGSQEITVKGATRGYKVVCGIITKGGAGSSYDSSMKTGGSVTINTLPDSPTVSASATLIASGSTGATLTATPGASNDTGQTSSVYYSTSASGSKIKYTSPIKVNPDKGKSATYYFWTSDGLEYSSSYISKTITKNSKPTVSITMAGTDLSSVSKVDGYNYVVTPTITATKGDDGQSSGNKYTFKLKYGANFDNLNSIKTYSAQSSNTLKIAEIRDIIGVNKYYKFSVIRNDGIEDSDEEETNNTYYITPMPEIKNFYNIGEAETVAPENYFSKKVRIYVNNDAGYSNIKLLANDTEFGTETKLSNSPGRPNQKFTNYDCSSLTSAKTYNFKIKFISSTGYSITTNVIKTLTKINSYSDELKLNWSDITKPFTTTEENPTFTNIFGVEPIQWEQWGFANQPSFTLSSFYNGKEAGTIAITPIFDYSSGKLKLTGENIYKLFTGENIIDATSLNNFSTKITLTVTNSFGDIYSWILDNKIINFKEEIEVEECTLNLNQDNKPNIVPQCIKEGICPYLTITCKSYQGPPNILKVVGLSGENSFYTYENTNKWSVKENSDTLGNNSPVSYIFQAPLPSILEQQQDLTENAEFKVAFSLANGVQDDLDFKTGLKVGKHIKGALSITEASYIPPENGDNGSIDLKININNWGASEVINNKKYKIAIQYKTPNGESWNICGYLQEKTGLEEKDKVSNTEIYNSNFGHNYNILPFISDIFKYENGNKTGEYDYIKIRLVMTTLAFASDKDAEIKIAETSKTFESLEYIIYNIKPTVAYRKNKLGINYDFVNVENKEDGVLMVSEYNNLNKIYLLHSEGSRNIDIKSGKLTGFVFNGGVWGSDLDDDDIGVIIGDLTPAENLYF